MLEKLGVALSVKMSRNAGGLSLYQPTTKIIIYLILSTHNQNCFYLFVVSNFLYYN